ncbi:MAG: HNH endonuclease [Desulfobacteraceae bacterium]|nr:HNH endonuclease [Desulfobacteraceae bacterium]
MTDQQIAEARERNRLRRRKYYQEHREEKHLYQTKYRRNHKEEQRLYQTKYYQEHKEEKRLHYQEHKEKRHLYNAKYYQEHKGKECLRSAKYRQEHLGKYSAWSSARRALVLGATIGNLAQVKEIYERARNDRKVRCYLCGKLIPKGHRHVDHIIPLSNSGKHTASNLAIACDSCNLSKHNKMPNEIGILL